MKTTLHYCFITLHYYLNFYSTRAPQQCMCSKSISKNTSNEKFLNVLLQGSENFDYNLSKKITKGKAYLGPSRTSTIDIF